MGDPLSIDVRKISSQATWFTLTKVVVRVARRLGAYEMELEGPDLLDELRVMQDEGEVEDIVSAYGIVHPPDEPDQVFAFRVDKSGPQVAANAPPHVVMQVSPRLHGVMVSE